MPLPQASKLRRRVEDAVDVERRVLPPLTVAARQPSLAQSPWPVQEPEVAHSAGHLRAIARQQQSATTKAKPPSQSSTGRSGNHLSPRAPVASLLPLKAARQLHHATMIQAHSNNNAEKDPVLQEIWRVAATAAKQQSQKAMAADTKNAQGHSSTREARVGPGGNQEAETSDGNGTTKARYRRLVGMVARKTLMRILHIAAEGVVRIRLENGCALCIQRLVRRFLGRRRRARLRFEIVDAVEKIERQWQRTKARREGKAERQKLLTRERERRQAEEARLAAARDIQVRYREFVEAKKQKEMKKAEEEEQQKRSEWMATQQRVKLEEKRCSAASVIQRMLQSRRGRAEERGRQKATQGAVTEAEKPAVELGLLCNASHRVDGAELPASPGVSDAVPLNALEKSAVEDPQVVVEPMVQTRFPVHKAREYPSNVDREQLSVTSQPSEQKLNDCKKMDDCVSPATTDTLRVVVAADVIKRDLREPLQLYLNDRGRAIEGANHGDIDRREERNNQSSLTVSACEHHLPHEDVSDTPSVSANAIRRARAVLDRFVRTLCLSRVQEQLQKRHSAACQLQQFVRQRLARQRVVFQRQLHLMALRGELQADWLQSESLFMASILGEEATGDVEPSPSHDTPTDHTDALLEDDDEGFSDDDEEEEGSKTHTAAGISWAELLPTRNGVVPSGLRLDFSESHGPASSAAPSVGLWKWSWEGRQWQPNRSLFSITNTPSEA